MEDPNEELEDLLMVALFDPYGTATKLLLPRIPEEKWHLWLDQVNNLADDPNA